ncbi:hypothetical protein BJ322DRAFT_246586 [Thelephora terrestris]|uniref:Uncharacterized protein n=1 Tax=Thelephora terrestris TaxID=56493 RepID=A0A9P6H9D8_9AGAM|nr:hypothetical protein BJ322DRAFT_246586 [Thelephora terrestris]
MMPVLFNKGNCGAFFTKGAPESNLDRCNSVLVPGGEILPMTESLRSTDVTDKTLSYASQGFVLSLWLT